MSLFFFSSRRRHTSLTCDWSSDVCSSDLAGPDAGGVALRWDLDQRGERELPVGRQRVLLAIDGGLRNRELVLVAVPQLEAERGALPVARPADRFVIGLAVQ